MNIVKAIIAAIIGGAVACLPIWGAYTIWAWCMATIPAGAWAGLIQVLLTIVLFLVGGSLTIVLAVGGFILAAAFVGFLLGLM